MAIWFLSVVSLDLAHPRHHFLTASSSSLSSSSPYYLPLLRFVEKVTFRQNHPASTGVRTDEVVYVLTSTVEGPICTAALLREAIRSAATLRAHCVRCDFDIVAIVDADIGSFLTSQDPALVSQVFDDVRVVSSSSDAAPSPDPVVFASNKPAMLLAYTKRPYVLFLDADVYSNHRAFPEALFDQLHKDLDLIMPYDWAHRHGKAWGRGVPGLCTCLIGFINAEPVRLVLQAWQDQITHFSEPQFEAARVALFDQPLVTNESSFEQPRDQELLTLVLHERALPEINLFSLTPEWLCPNVNEPGGFWIDAFAAHSTAEMTRLTANPCKAFHSHAYGQGSRFVGWGPPPLWKWVLQINKVGKEPVNPVRRSSCGGYQPFMKKG